MELKQIYEYFRENYTHINIQEINPKLIKKQMEYDYMKRFSIERQMDLLHDYIVSQNLCEVQL